MDWYITRTNALLETEDVDPFMGAAWIQFAFSTVHPFADGNGRVGCLLSSIPLLRANLPPVIVTAAAKEVYFAALKVASDTTGKNLGDLAS
jgi:Fic family protein